MKRFIKFGNRWVDWSRVVLVDRSVDGHTGTISLAVSLRFEGGWGIELTGVEADRAIAIAEKGREHNPEA